MILSHALIRAVLRGEKTEHRIPVRPGEERCPLAVGDSVSIRPPGEATVARVQVTEVGRELVRDLDTAAARREGFRGRDPIDAWSRAWLERHDRGYGPSLRHPVHPANADDVMDRIATHHAHREVWVVRFERDPATPPRMLHRHSERGYTVSPGEALPDEPEAVDELTQARITREAAMRNEDHRAAIRRAAKRSLEERVRAMAEQLDALEEDARAVSPAAAERARLVRVNLRYLDRAATVASGSGSGEEVA